MAYSNEVKEKVLEALQQGKAANKINEETGVSLATINKWKKEAGLTKSRNKAVVEKQKNEEVQETEINKSSTERKKEQVQPEITKINEQEIRQRLIDKWSLTKINGSDDEKIQVLKEYIDLEPHNLKLFNQIVRLLIKQGKIEEAEEYQKRAEEINPNNDYVVGNRIEICVKLRDFETAETLCKKAIDEDRKGSYFIRELADIYSYQGKYDLAEEVLKQHSDIFIGDYRNSRDLKLVNIYIKTNKFKQAEDLLQEINARDKNGIYTDKINLNLAWIEMSKGNFDVAKHILQKQYNKNPSSRVEYARLLLVTGEYESARKIIGVLGKGYKRKSLLLSARLEALQGNTRAAMAIIDNSHSIDKEYENMIIQKIAFTKSTIELLKREPNNEILKRQIQSIYEMAEKENDILLIHLIKREQGLEETRVSDFDIFNMDLDIPEVEDDTISKTTSEQVNERSDVQTNTNAEMKEDLKVLIEISKKLEAQGRLLEARKLIEEQLQIMPENEELLKRMYQIATRQGKWEEAKKYAHRRLKVNPNSLGTLKFLCFHARTDLEKRKYRKMAKDIIGRQDIKLRKKDIEIFGLENDVKIIPKEVTTTLYVKPSKVQKDSIYLYRAQIKQGNTTSEEAQHMLEELENDHSIRATALKAEIHLRVFSNPRGAKKIVEERSRLEGTTSKEKSSLTKISEIIRRAEKGIVPRELEMIR